MRPLDYGFVCFLVLLGAYIWVRDSGWAGRVEETWPILASIPLFVLLRRPWRFTTSGWRPVPSWHVWGPVGLLIGGMLANLTFFLALAWTWLLRNWMAARLLVPSERSNCSKLFVLPVLAFPWVATDLESLGWLFRLSGATAAESFFRAVEYDVVRQGTNLWVGGEPVSVEPACSGLNGLQSLLIAGTVLAWFKLHSTVLFWWNLPLLAAAAWLANTLRITALALCSVKAEWVLQHSFWHDFPGWIALCAVFGLCWLLFSLQAPTPQSE